MCQHRAVLSCLSLTCRRRKAGAPSSGDKAASTGDVGVPAGGGGAREASSKGTSMRRLGTAAGELVDIREGEMWERLSVKTRSYSTCSSPHFLARRACRRTRRQLARMSDDAAEGMARMSIKDRMKALEAQSGGAAPGPFAGGGGPQTRGGGGRVLVAAR